MNPSPYNGALYIGIYTQGFQRPMAIKFIMPIFLMIIKHVQVFVKHVLGDILSEIDISHATTILLHSNNCKSQHKSAKHFRYLQMLAEEKEKPVLRV